MRQAWFVGMLLSALVCGCGETYRPEPQSESGANDSAQVENDAAPSEADADEKPSPAAETPSAREVTVGDIQLTAPEGWRREQPRSDFVAAEFSLPKAEGDERDGRLTISMAGGSIEANIDRWRGQFGGQPEIDSQRELDVGGTTVTVVDLGGTYRDQAGPFAPAVERPNHRMLAAIIPGDDVMYFIKAYGPQPTMAQYEASFEQFVKTLTAK